MSPISLGAKVIDPYTPGCLVRQRYRSVFLTIFLPFIDQPLSVILQIKWRRILLAIWRDEGPITDKSRIVSTISLVVTTTANAPVNFQ
jgi:hypothetical protein